MSQRNTQPTHRAAALGSSISHSLPPVSHNAGYGASALNGREYPRILRKAGDLTGDGGAELMLRDHTVQNRRA